MQRNGFKAMNPPKRRVEIRDRYLVLSIGLEVGDVVPAGVGTVALKVRYPILVPYGKRDP